MSNRFAVLFRLHCELDENIIFIVSGAHKFKHVIYLTSDSTIYAGNEYWKFFKKRFHAYERESVICYEIQANVVAGASCVYTIQTKWNQGIAECTTSFVPSQVSIVCMYKMRLFILIHTECAQREWSIFVVMRAAHFYKKNLTTVIEGLKSLKISLCLFRSCFFMSQNSSNPHKKRRQICIYMMRSFDDCFFSVEFSNIEFLLKFIFHFFQLLFPLVQFLFRFSESANIS